MSMNNNERKSSEKLRQLAIKKLKLESTVPHDSLAAQKTEDMFHELRVHQIELEIQNEELKHSQRELELSREKYFKLYDVAPVGYCTLSETGLVMDANLKACELFGLDRIYFKRQLFSSFIFKDDLYIYYQAVKNLSETGDSQTCELRFIRRNGTRLWVLLDISSIQDSDGVSLYLVAVSDITGRKQAEIELQREHERLSNILEGTNTGTWEWNVQTGEAVVNERWAEIIGYTLKEISPVSIKTWKSFIHPDDLVKSNEQLDKVFNRESEYYNIECRMKHKNGSWAWVHDRGKVISWTPGGRSLLMSGTHTDITERKQTEILSDQMVVFAEEILKTGKEEVTYQKILENLLFISKAKYGILTIKSDMTNKFTTVAIAGIKNSVKKLSKLLGFELIGREWEGYKLEKAKPEEQVVSYFSTMSEFAERVIPKNISKPIEKLFNLGETIVTKIIVDNKVIGDFTLIMPYGQKFKMDSFVEIYSRQIDMFFTRKKVEYYLIETAQRLEIANAAGGVGIWNFDLVTNNLVWDDQMFALYGISRDQFSGVYDAWIAGLHPDDVERGDRAIQMAAKGEKEFDIEFRVIWPDGTIHHINARAQVRRDSSGKPLEMIGTNYDITNRKRAEEAVLHLSYHDMLTGLYNRRFFEEEIKRLDTERQLPLSIIIGDLNNLKLTNDTFGHLEGDRLLKETAKLLKAVCRSDDILARWGGDEFVILLPKTLIAAAEVIAQRIEKECSELFIQKIPIGLAIGIAAKTERGRI